MEIDAGQLENNRRDCNKLNPVIETVTTSIQGRAVYQRDKIDNLLEIIRLAGDGDYLEIGVLFGGSLASVALYKQQLGHLGNCTGIDTFAGIKDKQTGLFVTYDNARSNLDLLDLKDVVLIKGTRDDIPESGIYKVAYIDGGHEFPDTWLDFLAVKDRAEYIVFDDYDEHNWPDVFMSCDKAALDNDYELFQRLDSTFVLRRNNG